MPSEFSLKLWQVQIRSYLYMPVPSWFFVHCTYTHLFWYKNISIIEKCQGKPWYEKVDDRYSQFMLQWKQFVQCNIHMHLTSQIGAKVKHMKKKNNFIGIIIRNIHYFVLFIILSYALSSLVVRGTELISEAVNSLLANQPVDITTLSITTLRLILTVWENYFQKLCQIYSNIQ